MCNTTLFDDTATAFELKSGKELNRSLFLFGLMGNQFLVNAGSRFTRAALKYGLPVKGLIRETVFRQFCGGITEEECKQVTEALHRSKLHSILDYSVEAKEEEEQFNEILQKKLDLIRLTGESEELCFAVFKLTALCPPRLLEKISRQDSLSDEEVQQWLQARLRVDRLCASAYTHEVRLYADAEESWLQPAIDELVKEMMQKYNKKKVIIYNTIQCYRWDRLEYLKELHEEARNFSYKIGVKIVRGAYLEKENRRAELEKYLSPICRTKEETDANFDSIMEYCFRNLEDIHLFIGTHNEASTLEGMRLMKTLELQPGDPRVWFSQLYGMSDHISFNLSRAGYNTAKLVPFGPVGEVVPYLLRRAQENTSVAGQAGRELSLLQKEKRRRSLNSAPGRLRSMN